MSAQQLLLSWKDHNEALVSVFENLLKSNSLVDCTLAAEGQYLKAHKLVLSACSSYFELLFNQESEKNPIVILKEVKFADLESAVNFMYRGEVEVSEDRLAAFLEVADTLQIKGLGSDRGCQSSRNKPETPVKSTKSSVPSQQFSRESRNNVIENAVKNKNTVKLDLTSNNESLSQIQQPQRDTPNSSQSLAVGSSFSLASTSGSGRPGRQSNMESSSSSQFPIVEIEPIDVNTVIKTEPVTEEYIEKKSDEVERDFGDVTLMESQEAMVEDQEAMMQDQEDWNEPNPESVGDDEGDEGDDADDQDYTDAAIKSEDDTSENVEPLHAVDVPAADEAWSEIAKEEAGPSTWNPQLPADLGTDTGPSAPGTDDGNWNAKKEIHQPKPGLVPTRTAGDVTALGATQQPPEDEQLQCYRSTAVRRFSPEVFSASAHYESHKQQHAPERRFKCPECRYTTASKSLWERHLRSHTSEQPFKCQHCAFSGAHSGDFTKHMRIHSGARPYKCEQCSYSAAQRSNLTTHMRIHSGARPYKCEQCGYSAAQRGNLTKHMRIHSGERPYKCELCSYSATQSGTLNLHMRIHTGKKPYKCEHCDYSSGVKCNLISHMLVHSGERRF